jgi:hypothetical protein
MVLVGASLALAAVIGGSALALNTNNAGAPALAASRQILKFEGHSSRLPRMTIYLAGSEAEAEAIREAEAAAAWDRYLMDIPEPAVAPVIFVVDSPEAEVRATGIIAGFYEDAVTFGTFEAVTVDLRATS